VREVLERPRLRLVPHVGYVSLFPFIWRLIPPVSCTDNLILKTLLDLLFGARVVSYWHGNRKRSLFFIL
jgi:mannosyl-oligosaccharide glucosidase